MQSDLPLPPAVSGGVQLALFGVYMGGSFAPNHKGMAIIPRGAAVDFVRRQARAPERGRERR